MAILKNCELHWVKCDPNKPDRSFEKDGMWGCQLRTSSLSQKNEWVEQGLKPKLVVHKEGEEEGLPVLFDGKKQWRVNLSKRCVKRDKSLAEPVKIVNGQLEDVDPRTIGNGSIGNVRVFQYDSTTREGEKVSMLMAIQLTKYIVYEPRNEEDSFDTENTEVVKPAPFNEDESDEEGDTDEEDDDIPFDSGSKTAKSTAKSSTPSKPAPKKPGAPPKKTADDHPEDSF